MINYEKPPLNDLIHFGVLGMHWGRHKAKESNAVREARAEVTRQQDNLKKTIHERTIQTHYGLLPVSKKIQKKVALAEREHEYSKEDLVNTKILDHLKGTEKSKRQLNLENKYKQKGMNDDEAAIAAYKNLRTKKILAVVGGVALTALVAYSAYKIHDARVDKIIKSGTLLQNISSDSTKGVRDAFYSSTNSLDKVKYRGLYGAQLTQTGGNAYQKQIKAISDIKQASPKNAKAILENLIKTDPEFSTGLRAYMKSGSRLGGTYAQKTINAEKSLAKGFVDKDVYEVFNASLVDHAPEMQTLTDKFYNVLSKKGYNAIKDVNDSKYSGYAAINPIITFNSKGKVDVVEVKELVNNEINKAKTISMATIAGSALVKQGAAIATGYFGIQTISKAGTNRRNQEMTLKYRRQHPETNLTNTEIIRMVERSKLK